MPFMLLSIAIQVAFVLHVLKTGRDTMWIWIVVLLPVAGSIAYLILEVLPGAMHSRSGRTVQRQLKNTLAPNADLKEAKRNFSRSMSVENAQQLAQECYNKGLFDEAKELYTLQLKGIHKDDPQLLAGLARCQFALGEHQGSKASLDQLIAANPDFKSQECHLLYARNLEVLNDLDAAEDEYRTLVSYYSGPDAAYHYARFLLCQHKYSQAKSLLQDIMSTASLSNRHYRTLHKDTLKRAEQALAQSRI